MKKFEAELATEIGWSAVDLETRDEYIRTGETNFGNFIADLMRT